MTSGVGLRPPIQVMLARAVGSVPAPTALPGGVQYEQKWDGYRLVGFGTPSPFCSPAAAQT